MSNPNDGGQAFPRAGYDGEEYRAESVDGMSLRDYFAAQALPQVAAASVQMAKQSGGEEFRTDLQIAEWCYQLADAMLAARIQNAPVEKLS